MRHFTLLASLIFENIKRFVHKITKKKKKKHELKIRISHRTSQYLLSTVHGAFEYPFTWKTKNRQ